MKKEKNGVMHILTIVVAIVVILEAVIIIEGFSNKKNNITNNQTNNNQQVSGKPTNNPQLTMSLKSDDVSDTLKLGGSKVVKVFLKSTNMDVKLDAIDLYVKYNPSELTISNLKFENNLPKPYSSKINKEKKMVGVNYLIVDPNGYEIKSGAEVELASFSVRASKVGEFGLEINTDKANNQSQTLIVQTATSQILPFNIGKMLIKVVK